MQLCPWYPIDAVLTLAPATAGVWQIRLATGLIRYPRGLSAMIAYGYADHIQQALAAWAQQHATLVAQALARHVHADRALYTSLVETFTARFGAAPHPPERLAYEAR